LTEKPRRPRQGKNDEQRPWQEGQKDSLEAEGKVEAAAAGANEWAD
jgi:hypothetical protein